jgi:hypothetical protein
MSRRLVSPHDVALAIILGGCAGSMGTIHSAATAAAAHNLIRRLISGHDPDHQHPGNRGHNLV